MKTPRRRARELAVQALYQAGINNTAAPEIAKNIQDQPDFAKADEETPSLLKIQKLARCGGMCL